MICLFQPLNIARHYTDDSVTIVEKSFGLVMHQALSSMGKERTCWLTAVKNKKFQKSTVIVNHIRQHNFATSILPVEMDSKTSTLLTKYIVSIHNIGAKNSIGGQRLILARNLFLKMADDSQTSQNSSRFSQSDLPELLNQYYKRLFPYKYFFQWLSYGGGQNF